MILRDHVYNLSLLLKKLLTCAIFQQAISKCDQIRLMHIRRQKWILLIMIFLQLIIMELISLPLAQIQA